MNVALMQAFSTDRAFAQQCDETDSLRTFRDRFDLPRGSDGKPLIYLAGIVAFVLNAFWEKPVQALIGFAIVTLGVPAWWLARKSLEERARAS